MNKYRGGCVVGAVVWACLAGLAAIVAASASGCARPAALGVVAEQNAANAGAYAANVRVLCNAARELARVQAGAMVQRSREHVSTDLIRIRASITPSNPTAAELADAGAPWAATLAGEAGELGARVNAAPPEQRAAVAASLADEHPATIDLAITSPGFSTARVLRDSVELDRVNAMIEGEQNAGVRRGNARAPDAILDPYLAARSAIDARDRYLAAVDRFVSTIDEQGRVLGVHADVLNVYASGPPLHGTVLRTFQNPDLRAATVDLVTQVWGAGVAADLRDRLRRADEAIGAVSAVVTH